MRCLWPLCWLLLCISGPASCRPLFPDRYDSAIQSATHRYWRDFDHWRAWKAQLYQESRLDPAAISPAGARGLAQFMPGSWDDTVRQLGWQDHSPTPHDADRAIEAGAYFMARLRSQWRVAGRTPVDRNDLAAASYNAGLGNVLKAQVRCHDVRLWKQMSSCLAQVTGEKNAHETITYVDRIAKWWREMEAS